MAAGKDSQTTPKKLPMFSYHPIQILGFLLLLISECKQFNHCVLGTFSGILQHLGCMIIIIVYVIH